MLQKKIKLKICTYTFVFNEQPIPIILKNSNGENTVSVGDKLKADLNSAGPLVLISTYATKKTKLKKIYTLLYLLSKNPPKSCKISQKRNS